MRVIDPALGLLLVAVLAVHSRAADVRVQFHAIKDRADVEETLKFFRTNLYPHDYDTRIYTSRGWDPRRRGTSLEIYVRDWVQLGKGDINGDGIRDWFYFFDHGCGSIGCRLWIVDGRPGSNELLCRTNAVSEKDVWITDRVTVKGLHELRTHERTYWRGSECIFDDDQIRDQLPSPDPLRP